MIKFFRRIRQKLLAENKFSKYLIYAIGEIFLVVIGILIALQINNINEEVKIDRLERALLAEVKSGLEYDLNQIRQCIDFHRSSLKSQNIIIDWVDGNTMYNDSLGRHFIRTVFNRNFSSKEAPYETLKQVGLKIIKNDSLRNQISSLYDLEYQNLYWWQEDYERMKSRFRNSLSALDFEVVDAKEIAKVHFLPNNPSKLKQNKSFSFDLKTLSGVMNVFTNGIMTNAELEIIKTIQMIESEFSNNS